MSGRPPRRPVGLAVLGAATVLLIVWAYGTWRPPIPPAPWPTPSAAPPAVPPKPALAAPTSTIQPTPVPAVPPGAVPLVPPESADLSRRRLLLPVFGVRPEALSDTFTEARGNGSRQHEALDIPAPRNTPVLAVEDGTIAKLFTSNQGGLTVYQFDPSSTYAYYYAHLERYAVGLKEGDPIRRGQILGYVGTSGNAPPNAPHLHFAIFLLTPEKHWWQGTAIDPYPILRGSGTP